MAARWPFALVTPSFNGRTADSGSAYRGSNPWGAANTRTSPLFRAPHRIAPNSGLVRAKPLFYYVYGYITGALRSVAVLLIDDAVVGRLFGRSVSKGRCNQGGASCCGPADHTPPAGMKPHGLVVRSGFAGRCDVVRTSLL